MFWNSGGLGWSIGKSEYLTSGSHWHRSGLDTPEPWQGRWKGGVEVTCVPDNEEEEEDKDKEEDQEEDKEVEEDLLEKFLDMSV